MNYRNSITWKEINQTQTAFKNILTNTLPAIKLTAQAIKNANITHLVIAGRGSSNHALQFFKYICEIYTPYTVSIAYPSVVTRYNGKVEFKNCAIIGCSQSGKAQDCIEIMNKGKNSGCLTVAITNDCSSPMAKCANYHLFCDAGEEVSVAATKTFSAQLFIFALLVSKLSDNGSLFDRLYSVTLKINELINGIDLLTDDFSNLIKDFSNGFILSRGVTAPIALECALKLQETSYMQVKGYAYSDFYHGPMAMVNESTPIIFFLAKHDESCFNSIFQDQVECVEKMTLLNAPVYIVTTDGEIYKKYGSKLPVIKIPFAFDQLSSAFSFTIFSQILACKISCLKGLNPDEPRALKKVTVTV